MVSKITLLGLLLYICFSSVHRTRGSELLLTPLVDQGKIAEARNLSNVHPSLFLNVTSHSGFLTVNKDYDSHMFFWYFPAMEKPVNETALIIWLQGGPGASSLAGLFDEMGPFKYDTELKLNNWTWAKEYSMLFLDNPVGSGYSHTTNSSGYVTTMEMCANDLYKAIQGFLTIFPEVLNVPLFIAGESYAGRYVPAIAARILNENTISNRLASKNYINLKGIILGNPTIDRGDILDYSSVFYQWGLIDSQGVAAAKPLQDSYTKAVMDGDSAKAYLLRDELLTKLQDMPFQTQTYNLLADNLELKKFITFLELPAVRDAIHVGDRKFIFSNSEVAQKLIPEFLKNTSTTIQMLLDHYRVLIYCGQLDLTTPCVLNAKPRRSWRWGDRQRFLSAPRTPWWFADTESVAGYVKSGGGLTEVMVRGAGHLAPLDRPAQARQLVSYFIRGLDMPLPPNYEISKDVPDLPEDSVTQTTSTNAGLIVSIILNVVAFVAIVLGILYLVRLKRRYTDVFYADTSADGILTMS